MGQITISDFDKYNSTVGTSFTFVIKNVSCSDENEYTFTVEVGEEGSCYKTASLEMKGNYIILYKNRKKAYTPNSEIDDIWK